MSYVHVAHHRFDVSYSLLTRPIASLHPTFTMTTVSSAQANTEVLLTVDTDLDNGEQFYTHNGWQFLRRARSPGPRASLFYPAVAAFRLQDEPASGTSRPHARRLTLVTGHTCASSSPAPGRVELLIHRHLSQDDGRGLAEGGADSSRQELVLTFSLQSIDALQATLPTSAVHFENERSFNEHLIRTQNPPSLLPPHPLLLHPQTPTSPSSPPSPRASSRCSPASTIGSGTSSPPSNP